MYLKKLKICVKIIRRWRYEKKNIQNNFDFVIKKVEIIFDFVQIIYCTIFDFVL